MPDEANNNLTPVRNSFVASPIGCVVMAIISAAALVAFAFILSFVHHHNSLFHDQQVRTVIAGVIGTIVIAGAYHFTLSSTQKFEVKYIIAFDVVFFIVLRATCKGQECYTCESLLQLFMYIFLNCLQYNFGKTWATGTETSRPRFQIRARHKPRRMNMCVCGRKRNKSMNKVSCTLASLGANPMGEFLLRRPNQKRRYLE